MKLGLEKMLVEFKGEVALVVGDKEEITFSYQPEKPFLAASMIKLFILWELFRRQESGLDLNQRLRLNAADMVPGFGVLSRLNEGLMPTLYDLGVLMTIVSDNTATNLLIDYLGVVEIQKTCETMGWDATRLNRKMYDHESAAKGLDNWTSAKDIARFFQLLLADNVDGMPLESRKAMLNILLTQQCNNKLPGRIFNLPDGSRVPFAHKTGDIIAHEHDGGIFMTSQGPKIVVLLTGNLTQNWDGVHLHQEIGEYCWNSWQL